MSIIFPPKEWEIEITPWYADNEIYAQEVRFSIPYCAWSEFENSTAFQELKEYLENQKTEDMNTYTHEPEYKWENELIQHNQENQEPHGFFAVLRSRIRRNSQ